MAFNFDKTHFSNAFLSNAFFSTIIFSKIQGTLLANIPLRNNLNSPEVTTFIFNSNNFVFEGFGQLWRKCLCLLYQPDPEQLA